MDYILEWLSRLDNFFFVNDELNVITCLVAGALTWLLPVGVTRLVLTYREPHKIPDEGVMAIAWAWPLMLLFSPLVLIIVPMWAAVAGWIKLEEYVTNKGIQNKLPKLPSAAVVNNK